MTEEEKQEKKSRRIFLIRLIAYIFTLIVIPAAFLVIRFNLFQKVSKVSIGGWGIIFILLVAGGILRLSKEVKKGLPFCYLTQIIEGMVKYIIPLIATTLIIFVMRNSVKEFLQVLYVLIPCEIIAVAVNPLPTWAHENKLDEKGRNLKTILKAAGLTKNDGSIKKD